ncbi:MAG: dihydrofolate reductase [Homoserinimonas sp.]
MRPSTSRSSVGLIWAESEGGIIGSDGTLPWHLPEDLAHFKELTLGSPVVMGRKSWDALPERFRPLPGRRNIVVTRNQDWAAAGAEVAHSLCDSLQLAASGDGAAATIWVIGGAQVFSAAIGEADRLEVTQLRERFDGDTTAPAIDENWSLVAVDPDSGWHTSRTGIEYRYLSYQRR